MSMVDNFKDFMEDFWGVKFKQADKKFCIFCGSPKVHTYLEEIVEYDEEWEVVSHEDYGGLNLTGYGCENCKKKWGDFF